ncbi:hypothetical protein HHK36_009255 [Tetracentron sinense]|uniref:Uncharacterized protein n=1 Tax=Tetracentron sinense TaxID=13715 RepID=A0A835DKV1_TETSI|nr:hypothetical protein HHK36_009255 [Tetracentron sinense]
MVPPGPPSPVGVAQSVSPSVLLSNYGILGAQGALVPSQTIFPSLVSLRNQYNNMNLLGNMPSVSSLNHSFGNGGSNSGISGSRSLHRGGDDTGVESDPLSSVANGMGFTPSLAFALSYVVNPGSSGQVQGQQFPNPSGNQLAPERRQSQHLEPHNYQHGQQSLQQFFIPHNQQQQHHHQSIRGGLGGVGPV